MKKATVLFIAVVLLAATAFLGGSARASGDGGQDISGSVEESVEDMLDNLDVSGMNGLLASLDSAQLAVFGFSDIKERIRAVASGEYGSDFGSIMRYVASLLGADVFEYLPMMISCLAIVLAYNIINSMKSRFASAATERVVYFATGTLAVSLIVGSFAGIMGSAVKLVASIKTQINAAAPVLLTLMTAAGAASSAGVYSPSIAILAGGMTNVVTYIAFPALLMGLVFDIIGAVSTAFRPEKMSEFMRSACKWFLSTAFFVFIAVVGISGITASVRDGISVRVAKFALSKYVPVIGGYLSQGFDFVTAGNVLIKNAVGTSAIVLIALTAAPVLCRLAVFTLTLKLTAAIAEPLGGDKFGNVLTSVAKSSSVVAAVVAAMVFLYVLFLSIVICTGNMAL